MPDSSSCGVTPVNPTSNSVTSTTLLMRLQQSPSDQAGQFLMPGRDPDQVANPAGFITTIVLGIIGAVVGGYVSSQLFGWNVIGFNLPSIAVAVGGALALYRLLIAAGSGPTQAAHRR
jgi:uncharacterized membrane protein YeaQ/YmgE (transglycosylase-associated protein family)